MAKCFINKIGMIIWLIFSLYVKLGALLMLPSNDYK